MYSESLVGSIRTGLCKALMIPDLEGKWQNQKGKSIHFWFRIPKTEGAYEIAEGVIHGIRDFVWHHTKGLMTVINEDGSWERIGDPSRQEEIVKYCGWSSLHKFKEAKQCDYEARIIYWDYEKLKFKDNGKK